MLFTEPTFLLLFLPVLLALYFAPWSRGHGGYRNLLLLVGSVVFYWKGGRGFTWLMLGSIAFNYWMAILVDRARDTPRAGRVVAFAVAVNLVVLGIFKYANFLADNVDALFLALSVRPVVVPMRRPVVSKVGLFDQWPIILIDIETDVCRTGDICDSIVEPIKVRFKHQTLI